MKALVLFQTIALLVFISMFPEASATQSVPFNGRMSGSGIATSPTTNNIVATVYLEHLGISMLVGNTSATGKSSCSGFVGIERDTITAANGDQIFVEGNGVSCQASANPLTFQDTVTFTITGGTGRFADASGSGITQTTIIITSATGASVFTATITGRITY